MSATRRPMPTRPRATTPRPQLATAGRRLSLLLLPLLLLACSCPHRAAAVKDDAYGRRAPVAPAAADAHAPEPAEGAPFPMTPSSAPGAAPLPRAAMRTYLVQLCEWILGLDVGSNVLKGDFTPPSAPTHIFINGNFARVLLATYKITGNSTYLAEGLRWCDTFVGLQYHSVNSKGEASGYWDTGYKTVYIADTGTAVTALVLGYHMAAEAGRKATYALALQRYSRFVTGGCKSVPTLNSTSTPLGKRCPPAGQGWVSTEGKDAGSLGDGYYVGGINLSPYTIATATTGSCAFSELTSLPAAASWGIDFEQISAAAVRWLLASRTPDGVIPYILSLPNGTRFPGTYIYQAITYSAESFVSNALRFPSSAHDIAGALNSTVRWMVEQQNDDGTWGVLLSGDGERSPRVVSLLQWHGSVFPSADTTRAVQRFVEYLLKPANSKAFGVRDGILQSGFVGLVMADLLQPWASFSPPKPHDRRLAPAAPAGARDGSRFR